MAKQAALARTSALNSSEQQQGVNVVARHQHLLVEYAAATAHILSRQLLGSTLSTFQGALQRLQQFAAGLGTMQPLPAPIGLLTAFLTHCVAVDKLDSSTTALYLATLWDYEAKAVPKAWVKPFFSELLTFNWPNAVVAV